MRKTILIILTALGWVTIVARLYLRVVESEYSPLESIVQFFSYFTILTNLLVTIYCTSQLISLKQNSNPRLQKPENLTALTVFILIVGIVYHIALKPIWNPEGLTMVLSEIHHTVVPLGTLILWILLKNKGMIQLKSLLKWLLYPVLYISFTLIRGSFSNFYPYPFLNVSDLGLATVAKNSILLLTIMITLLFIFYYLGRIFKR
jgi:hypothetical protein